MSIIDSLLKLINALSDDRPYHRPSGKDTCSPKIGVLPPSQIITWRITPKVYQRNSLPLTGFGHLQMLCLMGQHNEPIGHWLTRTSA